MKISTIINKTPDIGKSAVAKQHKLTIAEAANLWNKLLARYDLIESILIFMNYVKDKDLRNEAQILLKKISQQTQQLEKVMAEYSVPLTPRPPSEIKILEDIASITDRYIFSRIFNDIKRFLPVDMVAFIQSTSSQMRNFFKKFLLEEMDIYNGLQDLGLKKNWLQAQPEYKGNKSGGQENPTIIEAAQMWVKLSARYDTAEFTNHMKNIATDPDLRAAISIGQDTLKKQSSELEKMMQKYAVPLPGKPPEAEITAQTSDAVSDRYIYRQIFRGIQSFLPIHMIAFQESINPAVQKKFKDLLTEEIDIYDKFISYGILKGWVFKPPSFKG
ncbi:hypothetical protein SPSYN_00943 [Sporotomaculum syntrophicum]|uniref:DUF3231 family protein n=1 Tax=Sporotomaculum syntrophicum TaxID=182264 RepID=A0A9D3AYL4_9FIRM|nr:DUF3231 family protein [Sporotomaculum syntrophicum]KAF1086202.1 hypothetical protein SPSYN_00943 [Sporotomaculum syntrophicum]